MSMRHASPAARKPTLGQVLNRAHLAVAIIAVGLAGLAMTAIGLLALRAHAEHNLQLIARSIAYTVEPAVVFNDPAATAESLALIAAVEEVAQARVSRSDAGVLAQWQRPPQGLDVIESALARLILPGVVVHPVMQGGAEVGRVEVTGHGGALLGFLAQGVGGLMVCLAASAFAGIYFSRRLVGRITHPLRELAAVAHAVRYDHDLAQRVGPTEIAELDELGQDFNTVLNGFEAWHRYLENAYTSMAHRATRDGLTGLHNRGSFENLLDRAVRDAEHRGHALALLYVDANSFKQVNDTLGHAAGDAVLRTLAHRLCAQVRDGDLVGRLGGDEFAVLLPTPDAAERAARVADGLHASMAAPIELEDGSVASASASVGIALFPQDGASVQALMASADAAMYRAKAAARNQSAAPSSQSYTQQGSSCSPLPENC